MVRRTLAALLAALTALLTGCGPAAPALSQFQRLTLSLTGSMANIREYEVQRTDDGAVLSLYDGWWDREDPNDRETYLARRISGGEDLYQAVLDLLNECGVSGWDGFSESDPNVLDGESFSLAVELSPERTITAHGSNAWPDGYHEFYQGLNALLDTP